MSEVSPAAAGAVIPLGSRSPTPSRMRRWLAVVQPLFTVLALGLLGLLLRSQWDALRQHPWRVRPGWVIVSAVCVVAAWLLEVRLWQRLLDLLGGRLAYAPAARIWFASAIARYVPGNIWQPIGLTMRCRERGVRAEATLASLSLFNVVHVVAVGPIAAVYLATSGRDGPLSQWLGSLSRWSSVALAIPVLCFVMRPQLILTMANYVLAKAGREVLPLNLSRSHLLALLGTSLLSWAFFAAGFSALAGAVMATNSNFNAALPHLAATYPIAFAVGFLSLVTPTGLVVREGMVFFMLGPIIGRADAIVVAISTRVLEVSLEAALGLGALSTPAIRNVARRLRRLAMNRR